MGEGRHTGLGARFNRGRFAWFAFLISASTAIAISPFGCGLDDNAVPELGGVEDGGDSSITLNEAGQPTGDGSDGCQPETCAAFPSVCSPSVPNGCGGTVDCASACPASQACIADSGTCDGPPMCRDAGAPGGNCGNIVNPGNGLEAGCGSCENSGYTCANNTCGCAAGGTVCGTNCCNATAIGGPSCNATTKACCTMKTCAANYPGTCNSTNDDGCGGNLDCSSGNCGAQSCDTTTHTCCTPESTTTACGNNCNTNVTNNCHVSTACGACATGTCASNNMCCTNTVCGGTCCTSGQECMGTTCCTPTGNPCNNACGVLSDSCGNAINCPGPASTDCTDGDKCSGSSGCKCGTDHCDNGQTCHIGGPAGGGHCGG